ncbi:cbb3-type cytochrome c oxidase subunit I [Bradyrhizobium sp. 17]|uniref:cbb3-type cytochrome c oxidase subunit I n=1 Tax=Bradyrhizobium sp. 17 TaxID=2782649 RepID=UPI001FF98703|nr:cbb3-type cytochrome c oxidase subunit I [Bradyrhizobium sp. 17]MCK1519327.1 cbb3-type cytochrome c oxidase subunit I [Bradyrhizobium sp. 17]
MMSYTATAIPPRTAAPEDPALARVLAAYVASATIWLVLTTAVGVLVSFKFAYPDFATTPALSFGRLRAIHTNGTFYAWASQALIGLALFVAARSSGARLYSERLAWISLALLNVAAVLGTVTLDFGFNYGQEYREWLWWIRVILGLGLITAVWNMIATVEQRDAGDIYISNWYTIGGTLWTIVMVVVSLLPWYQFGLGQVAVQAFFMHNAVGLWFTPLSLGVSYYALPKLLNRPIYSYSLGVFAFWTNLIFYPIVGAHHFEFSPLPWWLQTTAIVFSVAMLVPVLSGTANFLLTFRGTHEWIYRSPAVFILVAVYGYLLGSTQGTFEAFRSLQQLWHLTNYTVGHSHLTMYGFVTFAIWGGVYALLPRATGKYPYNLAMGIHFWLSAVGVVIYVAALSAAGTIQGLDWFRGLTFIQSVEDAAPYWLWRSVGGSLMFAGHLVFAFNVWTMTYGRSYAELAAAKTVPV